MDCSSTDCTLTVCGLGVAHTMRVVRAKGGGAGDLVLPLLLLLLYAGNVALLASEVAPANSGHERDSAGGHASMDAGCPPQLR